jgi:hypothetical protein
LLWRITLSSNWFISGATNKLADTLAAGFKATISQAAFVAKINQRARLKSFTENLLKLVLSTNSKRLTNFGYGKDVLYLSQGL